ncbi:hypothetical protein [Rhodococcus sp. NPDC057529]
MTRQTTSRFGALLGLIVPHHHAFRPSRVDLFIECEVPIYRV